MAGLGQALANDPINSALGIFGRGTKTFAGPQSSTAAPGGAPVGSLAASNNPTGMGGSTPSTDPTTLADNATNQINAAFANRAPQYAQYLTAQQNLYQQQLQQQNAVATRNLKFALARGGQTGGSLATDQGAELGREMAAGTIAGQTKAEGDLSSLESQDDSQRLQLISEAQAGSNLTTGAQLSAQAMQNNLKAAQSAGQAQQLGDVFGGISQSINQINNAKQTLAGIKAANGSVYGAPTT